MSLQTQVERWRSGDHVGEARPILKGFIQRGHLAREYVNLPDNEVFSFIPGLKGPNAVWRGKWVQDTDFMELPNIADCNGDLDFEKNGVETITIECDNIIMQEREGATGMLYHAVRRGYLSPTRGYKGPQGKAVGSENEFHGKFNDRLKLVITAGYGSTFFPIGAYLLDSADLTSKPDKITLTARSMGVYLTDQHTFLDAKHLWVRDPITFCDRQQADNLQNVARHPVAKTESGQHPARFAVDEDEDTAWISEAYGDKESLEWIEFSVPKGRYESLQLTPAYAHMEMYISIYATNKQPSPSVGSNTGFTPHATGGESVGTGWINHDGLGNVPGTTIPYTHHVKRVKERERTYRIRKGGGGFVIGEDSRIRIWFFNLGRNRGRRTWTYRAGVRNVKIFERDRKQKAVKAHWILVDDVSDIIKTVFQWAGFEDWEVESVGVRLSDKLVFDRQTFLVDIINRIAEMTSYVCFIKPPATFDEGDLSKENETNRSQGIAVFRQSGAARTRPREKVYAVRESDLLTGIQASFNQEALANSVRVRGRSVAKEKARKLRAQGQRVHALGADRKQRFTWAYRPVWARRGTGQSVQAALRRQEVHYDEMIRSTFEAKLAAVMIALRMALESAKAECEFPFMPAIYIDQQILIYDTGTGLSTRLWIASRSWQYTGGADREFKMSVAGSLLNVPDVQETREELQYLLNHHGFDPAPIARGPWIEPHFFTRDND